MWNHNKVVKAFMNEMKNHDTKPEWQTSTGGERQKSNLWTVSEKISRRELIMFMQTPFKVIADKPSTCLEWMSVSTLLQTKITEALFGSQKSERKKVKWK